MWENKYAKSTWNTDFFFIEQCLLIFLKYFLLVQNMLKELNVWIGTQFHIYTLSITMHLDTHEHTHTPHHICIRSTLHIYTPPTVFQGQTTHIPPLNTCTTQTQSHPCYVYTYNLKYIHHNYRFHSPSNTAQTHIHKHTLHTCMTYTHDLHVYKSQTHTHTWLCCGVRMNKNISLPKTIVKKL